MSDVSGPDSSYVLVDQVAVDASSTAYLSCPPLPPISMQPPTEHNDLDTCAGKMAQAVEPTITMDEALPRALSCLERAGAELAQNHFDLFCTALRDTSALLDELIIAVVMAQAPQEVNAAAVPDPAAGITADVPILRALAAAA